MTTDIQKQYEMIINCLTNQPIPNIGCEENRQKVLSFLLSHHAFQKSDIQCDVPIRIQLNGELYISQIDIIVTIETKHLMLIKCAAGSLASRERETIAAARLFNESYQIPYAIVSDGQTAIVRETLTGKKIKEGGLNGIPSRSMLLNMLEKIEFQIFPEQRLTREQLIFRTYDAMNINVQRNVHCA